MPMLMDDKHHQRPQWLRTYKLNSTIEENVFRLTVVLNPASHSKSFDHTAHTSIWKSIGSEITPNNASSRLQLDDVIRVR